MGTPGLERASRPNFPGRLESDKKAFASRFRPKRANLHGSGNRRTLMALPIKRALTTAPYWPANSPSAAASSHSPPDCDKAPPLRSFIPPKQAEGVAAEPQNSAPTAADPTRMTIERRPRRVVSRRNETADARVPRARASPPP